MYEHNALGYWSGLTLCLTKVRSSRARCPATALITHTTVARLKESMMGLRPRQGNLRQVFRLFKSHTRLCRG